MLTMISPVITSSSHDFSISSRVIRAIPCAMVLTYSHISGARIRMLQRLTTPQLKPVSIPVKWAW